MMGWDLFFTGLCGAAGVLVYLKVVADQIARTQAELAAAEAEEAGSSSP
jgi:hypothetical protein